MKLTWRELDKIINHKNETELRDMIAKEFDTFRRKTILVRLHQRFTILRAQREREELIGVRNDKTVM